MKIILRRKLKDYNAWKKMAQEKIELRRQYGSKGATIYRSVKDPNEVFVVFDWDDARSYKEYFERPDVRKFLADTEIIPTEIHEVSESFSLEA
ncbi:MAG: hypothetical protein HY420_04735 [Candidatus Kerfeldbacteria bacterium]|nr:hypothetical protein [Candidatus Kerfeldbacteria bacterium]